MNPPPAAGTTDQKRMKMSGAGCRIQPVAFGLAGLAWMGLTIGTLRSPGFLKQQRAVQERRSHRNGWLSVSDRETPRRGA